MTFSEAITSVISQYVGFTGRARRSEYWYYLLFTFCVDSVLALLAKMTGQEMFNVMLSLFNLGLFLPGLAVSIRRMHDTGKSGWFVLISLLPVVGSILLNLWFLRDSEPGTNKYGPNPKETYELR